MKAADLSSADGWLLSAATQPAPAARVAWERWRASCTLETAEEPSQALFPMVYANLGGELDGPDATRLKGVYRRTWYGNQLALARVQPLLDRLAALEITAVLLNDAAMVAGQHPDTGYRTIRCIDVLVRDADWNASLASAAEEGWRVEPAKSFVSPGALSIVTFAGPEDFSLRVWANLFAAEPRQDTEDRIWREVRAVQVNGRSLPALGPVEQLLCLSADVARMSAPPLYLYADAGRLARSLRTTADWSRLVWQAQRYEHVLPLRTMLLALQTRLGLELPSWVLPALRKMAISHGELLQYARACESFPLRLKSACLRWLLPFRSKAARAR
ncbi:MAG: nucleotidyltransferase family protein [Gemmatimonadales bacterium]